MAGMPLTMGCRPVRRLRRRRATPTCVRRLRDAGFVIVGKTKLPENGILPTTESRRFGPTRNPWALDRTPGGSSGGVGGGGGGGHGPDRARQRRRRLDPDPGGLLRAGRASSPRAGGCRSAPTPVTSFLVTDGVLTRTVADTAAALDVLAGYEPGDATWAAAAAGGRSRSSRRRARDGCGSDWRSTRRSTTPRSTRSAWPPRATRRRLLESLGHDVEEFDAAVVGPRAAARLHAGLRAGDGDGHVRRRPDRRPRADRGRTSSR